jgi:hypothetical protein
MDELLAQEVRERAGGICEYCHLPQDVHAIPFEIDHIIARQHGGKTILSNLALSCLNCNAHKGPNISGLDPVTSRTKLVHLFNPRRHKWGHHWGHHFRWDGPQLVGKTAVGRATIRVLAMNAPDVLRLRQMLIEEGRFPPIQEGPP